MSKGKKKPSPADKRAAKAAERKEWTQAEIDAAMAFPKGKDEDSTRSPGRPSNYPRIDLERVQSLAAGGLTKYEISDALGISETSRKEYEAKFPAFSAAIAKGRAKDVAEVENALHRSAKGYTVVEDRIFYDSQIGKVVIQPTIKRIPPDTRAGLAILQHSETGSWKPKQEITIIDPIAEKLQKARERAKRG